MGELSSQELESYSVERAPMSVAGLFAGIGGIELGLARSGHRAEVFCEIEEPAVCVLEKRFPGVRIHRDVCTLRSLPRDVELLTAGFPCQDLSQAGKTVGIQGKRSGLISEVFRLLGRRKIPWILIENVPFMLHLGGGRAMGSIINELETRGYRWAYRVVDTIAFGIPQRRRRVLLVACLEGDPRDVLLADDVGEPDSPAPSRRRSFGFYWTEGNTGIGAAVDSIPTLKGGSSFGIPSSPAIVLPSGRIITPDIRDAERLQGFEADWTAPAVEATGRQGVRWKLVGNAVTVDVAEWLGSRLRRPGQYDSSGDAPLRRKGAWPKSAWSMGKGRFASDVSAWPLERRAPPIHRFLEFEGRNLSARATAGFLTRLQASSLRSPDWFERLLEEHLDRMSG